MCSFQVSARVYWKKDSGLQVLRALLKTKRKHWFQDIQTRQLSIGHAFDLSAHRHVAVPPVVVFIYLMNEIVYDYVKWIDVLAQRQRIEAKRRNYEWFPRRRPKLILALGANVCIYICMCVLEFLFQFVDTFPGIVSQIPILAPIEDFVISWRGTEKSPGQTRQTRCSGLEL